MLLFLFPLMGNSIKSWTGLMFVCLLILGLIAKPWQRVSVDRYERWNLILFVLIFIAILVSGLANGWSDGSTRGLGIYIRYLAFIPIYFLMRSIQGGVLAFAV